MEKDFDAWSKRKKNINSLEEGKFYTSREIWWATLGTNIGHEQDGRGINFNRPVLIITAFSKGTCLIVPLTTSEKRNRYYVEAGDIDGVPNAANISQLRLIDTRRLTEKICMLNEEQFLYIRKNVRSLI